MHARAVEDFERRLGELHRDELQEFGLGGAALAASFAAATLCPPLVIPLFVGGIAVAGLGIRASWRHWDLLDQLADDRDAYTIPEVRDYAAREARIERRAYYAALIRSWTRIPQPWVAEVTLPGLAFRYEMNSGNVVALILPGLTMMLFGTCAITMMGSNFAASKDRFGYRF